MNDITAIVLIIVFLFCGYLLLTFYEYLLGLLAQVAEWLGASFVKKLNKELDKHEEKRKSERK